MHLKHRITIFGCQPDEPLASLVTTNRITNDYGFIVCILLFMYSVLHCLYSVGNNFATTTIYYYYYHVFLPLEWGNGGLGGLDRTSSSNGNIFRVTGHLCGNSPITGEFPALRPVTRSFDVFFDLRLNKRLSKQSGRWWFETLSRPLWRHSNDITMFYTLGMGQWRTWRSGSYMLYEYPSLFKNCISGLRLNECQCMKIS